MVGHRRAIPLPSDPCADCGEPRTRGLRFRCAICDAPLCKRLCSVPAPHAKHKRVCVAGDCHAQSLAMAKAVFDSWRAEQRAKLDAELSRNYGAP